MAEGDARGQARPMSAADHPTCSCYYLDIHEGAEADRYIENHLEKVRADSETWTVEYRCPDHGKRWLRDQPWGEMHGGGLHRLRTIDRVRRDLRSALSTVPFAIPDDRDAAGLARSLMEKATDDRR